ncbi:MAG: protein DA1 [Fusobacteria bacterium]|nr:protein DA1 [Fusobacteriota bacterium]
MKCVKCNIEIEENNSIYIDGNYFHKNCVRCTHCNEEIDGEIEYISGNDNNFIHKKCLNFLKNLTCCICLEKIKSEHYTDIWGNRFHIAHEMPHEICSVCLSVIHNKNKINMKKYNNGIIVCGECNKSAVTNEVHAFKLKYKVFDILKENKIFNIPDNIPVKFMDMSIKMKDKCLGFNRKTEKIVNKKNNIKNKIIYNEIYMAYGLPEMEFESVLAHELMHVWITQNNIKLDHNNVEGLCNLGSAFVYKKYNNEKSKMLLNAMFKLKDKAYGKKFKKYMYIYEEKGIEGVFEYIGFNQ